MASKISGERALESYLVSFGRVDKYLRRRDFITGVGAFKSICGALKDHGGAATEYQEVNKELDAVQNIVQGAGSIPGNTSAANNEVTTVATALAAQADFCLKVVRSFTERLAQHDPTLGKSIPQGYTRGTWSKLSWALFFSSELKKVRPVIVTHTSSITLSFCHLLYLHSLASEESLIKQHEQAWISISNNFSAVTEKLDSNHAAFSSQNTSVLQSLNDLGAKMGSLVNQQLDSHDKLKQVATLLASDFSKHLAELNSNLERIVEEMQAPNTRSLSTEIGRAMDTGKQNRS
ncbi:hypothetical protein AYL99_03114 [Fonsecaea erecta]|uniref:Fungal N-terminal domain-containing protein n=1 Tax=Fonsecaea erecta TaxID=1367422 RepID=A0A178ZVZ2_9EURO|nr:hypothetical protein AYL99_03114 [Fonsecaea erecta]OAP63887.1 hypothetical protein AYL99_03114 [Fonsecaea erecta]